MLLIYWTYLYTVFSAATNYAFSIHSNLIVDALASLQFIQDSNEIWNQLTWLTECRTACVLKSKQNRQTSTWILLDCMFNLNVIRYRGTCSNVFLPFFTKKIVIKDSLNHYLVCNWPIIVVIMKSWAITLHSWGKKFGVCMQVYLVHKNNGYIDRTFSWR